MYQADHPDGGREFVIAFPHPVKLAEKVPCLPFGALLSTRKDVANFYVMTDSIHKKLNPSCMGFSNDKYSRCA